ncbi:hypothetical protein ASG90_16295 [Nocardioides sp. Soil797]|nr:hypothetical protein ASG90_16295 [Nocardioides sp. Soil797]
MTERNDDSTPDPTNQPKDQPTSHPQTGGSTDGGDGEGSARWLPAAISVVAVVAVVALILGLKLVGGDDPDDTPVDKDSAAFGQVVHAADVNDPLVNGGQVVLPWIRLEVAAGEPVDEVPATKKQEAISAPDGGSFVRVEVSKQGTVAFALSSKSPANDVDLLLRADGTDYSLTKGADGLEFDSAKPWLFQSRESRWVSVEGHPEDLQIVLRIGDVEQVVDASDGKVDLGDAAALADVPSVDQNFSQFPCGQGRSTGGSAPRNEVPCTITSTLRTPYVDGVGWAEAGDEYLVVNVATGKSVALGAKQASIAERTASFGDADLVDTLDRGKTTQFIFDVTKGEKADLKVGSTYGASSAKPDAELEWSIAGSKL